MSFFVIWVLKQQNFFPQKSKQKNWNIKHKLLRKYSEVICITICKKQIHTHVHLNQLCFVFYLFLLSFLTFLWYFLWFFIQQMDWLYYTILGNSILTSHHIIFTKYNGKKFNRNICFHLLWYISYGPLKVYKHLHIST